MRERRTVLTSNAEADPRFNEAPSVARYDVRAVLCSPCRWQGEPVGAVYLERNVSKEPFVEEDAQHLQDLGDLLGIAFMAWRAHLVSRREDWERERLERTFPPARVASILAAGGGAMVRRDIREACVLSLAVPRHAGLLDGLDEEAWRLISQLYAQAHEIVLRHGGVLLSAETAVFEAVEGKADEFAVEAVRAAVEIQRAARPLVKRLARENKMTLTIGLAAATGRVLAGYFGAGRRVDYWALGDPMRVAHGLAATASDGEVLIEHATQSRVRIFLNTHRLAPVTLPGIEQQVQIYRVVPY